MKRVLPLIFLSLVQASSVESNVIVSVTYCHILSNTTSDNEIDLRIGYNF